MKVTDFSGSKCGKRYEREYVDKFRDCMVFYFDGKLRFERYCYGEGACLVFGVWGDMNENGEISYKKPLDLLVKPEVLPQRLTNFDGDILFFDESPKKWSVISDFSSDKINGYSSLSCLIKKIFK